MLLDPLLITTMLGCVSLAQTISQAGLVKIPCVNPVISRHKFTVKIYPIGSCFIAHARAAGGLTHLIYAQKY